MALLRWTPRTELWSPFDRLTDLQEEMNRLFDSSLRPSRSGVPDGGMLPPCDIFEEKDKMLVRVDLPGFRKEDVHVTLQEGILTIRGERKAETKTKDATCYAQERMFGAFTRSMQLPISVEAGKIEATFRDGVLEVALPKAEEAKPKQIEVKVS